MSDHNQDNFRPWLQEKMLKSLSLVHYHQFRLEMWSRVVLSNAFKLLACRLNSKPPCSIPTTLLATLIQTKNYFMSFELISNSSFSNVLILLFSVLLTSDPVHVCFFLACCTYVLAEENETRRPLTFNRCQGRRH